MGARQLNTTLMKEFGIHCYDMRIGGKVVKGLHRKVFELLQVVLNW